VPAAAVVNVVGDEMPEIAVSLNDGFIYLFDGKGNRLWRTDYSHGKEIMRLDEVTLGDAFAAAGYATGAFGKWHNGEYGPYHPNHRGFHEFSVSASVCWPSDFRHSFGGIANPCL
jgi:hypothetical protein